MTAPLVSIMMPAYNAEAFIAQAIESVLAQTMTDWELIIVDDGSTDGTPAVTDRYQDPGIRVLRQPNGGESIARNTALQHMRGSLVAFLDADDVFLPSTAMATIATGRANVCSRFRRKDEAPLQAISLRKSCAPQTCLVRPRASCCGAT
jgi:glycosyltransferase involved in cell wall biosynthesis